VGLHASAFISPAVSPVIPNLDVERRIRSEGLRGAQFKSGGGPGRWNDRVLKPSTTIGGTRYEQERTFNWPG
jgi:hypothetical protein